MFVRRNLKKVSHSRDMAKYSDHSAKGDGKSLCIASFTLVHPAIQTRNSSGEQGAPSVCYTKVTID
jgi:hypothetical protein